MDANRALVIVGASLAGAKAAEGAREAGFDGKILLVGAESRHPYERPELSKGYLQGKKAADDLYVHPRSWYEENEIEVRTETEVTAISPADHRISTQTGEQIPFGQLILATGSRLRRLDVPGVELSGVYYLRTMDDSDRLRDAFARQPRVVVIGGGWIGLETTAAARLAGAQVEVVEAAEQPLLPVLGPEIAPVFTDLHREHDVAFHLGTTVKAIHGQDRVELVELAAGKTLAADVVVIGIGIIPNDELATAAGLHTGNGVHTDDHLRTSAAGVFAAGDCANVPYPVFGGRRLRTDHWANALNQGLHAGRVAGGRDERYDRIPYVFSDQYDLGLEYSGSPDQPDRVVVRGDLAKREFIAFWLRDGYVQAGMNVNIWDVNDAVQALIRSGRRVDPDRLADPAVELADLAS